MNDGIHRVLNSRELSRLGRLFMSSRFTVEGQLQGAHRSPLKGFSIEFADYRQYVAGDDLRHLDWRVYGRNERLYIRQYEEECRLRVFLLVDGSNSMAYGFGDTSKYAYAAKLAAALAYVTVQQQDSVGLSLLSQRRTMALPAKSGLPHLRVLANALADHVPQGELDLARAVHQAVSGVRRRALFVIISDLLVDLPALRRACGHFRKRRHDVIIHHVLDRAEIEFPFREMGNFRDLETGRSRIANPVAVRRVYQQRVMRYLEEVQSLAADLDADYTLAVTDTPFVPLIRRHLNRRLGKTA